VEQDLLPVTALFDDPDDDIWLWQHLVAGYEGLDTAEFALPVVRVIVPGLEGPDEHFSDYVPGLRARALMDAADPAGLS